MSKYLVGSVFEATFADRCARATCAAIARLEANARRHHHDFARKPKICVDVSSHSRKR